MSYFAPLKLKSKKDNKRLVYASMRNGYIKTALEKVCQLGFCGLGAGRNLNR